MLIYTETPKNNHSVFVRIAIYVMCVFWRKQTPDILKCFHISINGVVT